MQGPCEGNQLLLSNSGMLEAVNGVWNAVTTAQQHRTAGGDYGSWLCMADVAKAAAASGKEGNCYGVTLCTVQLSGLGDVRRICARHSVVSYCVAVAANACACLLRLLLVLLCRLRL